NESPSLNTPSDGTHQKRKERQNEAQLSIPGEVHRPLLILSSLNASRSQRSHWSSWQRASVASQSVFPSLEMPLTFTKRSRAERAGPGNDSRTMAASSAI